MGLYIVGDWELKDLEPNSSHGRVGNVIRSGIRNFVPLAILSVVFLEKIFLKNGLKSSRPGFPGGAVVESLPATAGDTGSSPGLGRSHMPRSN